MTKLIEAYRADRTLKNAQKLRAYDRKHSMAACLLLPFEAELLREAIFLANVNDD